ncbi:MAG: ABC transporter permease [Chloroflexi bacterium]|nr:ABC transporter permease [Chloroflexota bacterium]
MGRYLLWRTASLVPVLLGVSALAFALMHLVPGGPWDAEKALGPAVVENLNRRYGLDLPLWQQYLSFLLGVVKGDLGVSYLYQDRGVTEILLRGLPVTASLGLLALGLALAGGLSLGAVAATRQNDWPDYLAVLLATAGASVPSFVLGIFLVALFAVTLGWLPSGGWGALDHAILPALALAAYPAAYLARITRSALLEVLHQDYVRTARAKGLYERRVLLGHALRNALIPVLTVSGPLAASFVTGSFIVESLFSVPGIGRLFVQAVFARDYGLILGATLVYALAVVLANYAVDVLYAVVDPRIRYS